MDTIDQIVETGYFGDATAEDIRAICVEATKHGRGYLLLPKGSAPALPLEQWYHVGVDGDLDVDEYVELPASFYTVNAAAEALLNAISDAISGVRYAIVGTDGARDVVWGIGTTEDKAWDDAERWLSELVGSYPKLRVEQITRNQYELVVRFHIDWNELKGIAS